jgi:SAM-dependent methyltransferase
MSEKHCLVPTPELIDSVRVGRGDFIKFGNALVSRFISNKFIASNHTFLDIGCGLGRVARPLTEFLTPSGRYIGFDINKTSIDWCSEKYKNYPNFSFEWIDLKSTVYNPTGTKQSCGYTFPVATGSVDFVNLTSVFTHMLPQDVRAYLKEIARMMKNGAICHITYFLQDFITARVYPSLSEEFLKESLLGCRAWHSIEGGFLRNKEQPEDVVILDERLVRDMYVDAGLTIQMISYGGWADIIRQRQVGGGGQDVILATK